MKIGLSGFADGSIRGLESDVVFKPQAVRIYYLVGHGPMDQHL